eukprot:sb/3460706/
MENVPEQAKLSECLKKSNIISNGPEKKHTEPPKSGAKLKKENKPPVTPQVNTKPIVVVSPAPPKTVIDELKMSGEDTKKSKKRRRKQNKKRQDVDTSILANNTNIPGSSSIFSGASAKKDEPQKTTARKTVVVPEAPLSKNITMGTSRVSPPSITTAAFSNHQSPESPRMVPVKRDPPVVQKQMKVSPKNPSKSLYEKPIQIPIPPMKPAISKSVIPKNITIKKTQAHVITTTTLVASTAAPGYERSINSVSMSTITMTTTQAMSIINSHTSTSSVIGSTTQSVWGSTSPISSIMPEGSSMAPGGPAPRTTPIKAPGPPKGYEAVGSGEQMVVGGEGMRVPTPKAIGSERAADRAIGSERARHIHKESPMNGLDPGCSPFANSNPGFFLGLQEILSSAKPTEKSTSELFFEEDLTSTFPGSWTTSTGQGSLWSSGAVAPPPLSTLNSVSVTNSLDSSNSSRSSPEQQKLIAEEEEEERLRKERDENRILARQRKRDRKKEQKKAAADRKKQEEEETVMVEQRKQEQELQHKLEEEKKRKDKRRHTKPSKNEDNEDGSSNSSGSRSSSIERVLMENVPEQAKLSECLKKSNIISNGPEKKHTEPPKSGAKLKKENKPPVTPQVNTKPIVVVSPAPPKTVIDELKMSGEDTKKSKKRRRKQNKKRQDVDTSILANNTNIPGSSSIFSGASAKKDEPQKTTARKTVVVPEAPLSKNITMGTSRVSPPSITTAAFSNHQSPESPRMAPVKRDPPVVQKQMKVSPKNPSKSLYEKPIQISIPPMKPAISKSVIPKNITIKKTQAHVITTTTLVASTAAPGYERSINSVSMSTITMTTTQAMSIINSHTSTSSVIGSTTQSVWGSTSPISSIMPEGSSMAPGGPAPRTTPIKAPGPPKGYEAMGSGEQMVVGGEGMRVPTPKAIGSERAADRAIGSERARHIHKESPMNGLDPGCSPFANSNPGFFLGLQEILSSAKPTEKSTSELFFEEDLTSTFPGSWTTSTGQGSLWSSGAVAPPPLSTLNSVSVTNSLDSSNSSRSSPEQQKLIAEEEEEERLRKERDENRILARQRKRDRKKEQKKAAADRKKQEEEETVMVEQRKQEQELQHKLEEEKKRKDKRRHTKPSKNEDNEDGSSNSSGSRSSSIERVLMENVPEQAKLSECLKKSNIISNGPEKKHTEPPKSGAKLKKENKPPVTPQVNTKPIVVVSPAPPKTVIDELKMSGEDTKKSKKRRRKQNKKRQDVDTSILANNTNIPGSSSIFSGASAKKDEPQKTTARKTVVVPEAPLSKNITMGTSRVSPPSIPTAAFSNHQSPESPRMVPVKRDPPVVQKQMKVSPKNPSKSLYEKPIQISIPPMKPAISKSVIPKNITIKKTQAHVITTTTLVASTAAPGYERSINSVSMSTITMTTTQAMSIINSHTSTSSVIGSTTQSVWGSTSPISSIMPEGSSMAPGGPAPRTTPIKAPGPPKGYEAMGSGEQMVVGGEGMRVPTPKAIGSERAADRAIGSERARHIHKESPMNGLDPGCSPFANSNPGFFLGLQEILSSAKPTEKSTSELFFEEDLTSTFPGSWTTSTGQGSLWSSGAVAPPPLSTLNSVSVTNSLDSSNSSRSSPEVNSLWMQHPPPSQTPPWSCVGAGKVGGPITPPPPQQQQAGSNIGPIPGIIHIPRSISLQSNPSLSPFQAFSGLDQRGVRQWTPRLHSGFEMPPMRPS